MLRQLLDRLVPNGSGARPPAACLDCRSGVHEGCSGWCACEVSGHGAPTAPTEHHAERDARSATEGGAEVARERR